MTEESSA